MKKNISTRIIQVEPVRLSEEWISDIKNVTGNEFDKAYILKISERSNWDFDKTINCLLDYKENLLKKQAEKQQLPVKENKKVVEALKNPHIEELNKNVHIISQKSANQQSSHRGSGNNDVLIADGSQFPKNIRKLSTNDIKELPLNKANWNASYPIINYPEFYKNL